MNLDPFAKADPFDRVPKHPSFPEGLFIKSGSGGGGQRRPKPIEALEPLEIPTIEPIPIPAKKNPLVFLRNPKWETAQVGLLCPN